MAEWRHFLIYKAVDVLTVVTMIGFITLMLNTASSPPTAYILTFLCCSCSLMAFLSESEVGGALHNSSRLLIT